MKYINTTLGNHRFEYKGQIIIAWVVVGSETICVSLNNFKGEWKRFKGNFKKVYAEGIEGMQKFLESHENDLNKWLPIAIETAMQKEAEELAKRQAEQAKEQAKIDKDRAIPLFRSITIKKGKHKISIATQPFECSIYVAISDSKISSLIQSGFNSHRATNNVLNKTIKGFEAKGYKVSFHKEKYEYKKAA